MNKKQLLIFITFIIVGAFGESLNYVANVGVSPYEALALTLNYITHIEVGTIAFSLNCLFIVLQLLFLRKIKVSVLLQIPVCFLQSLVINFFTYNVLGGLTLNYPMRIVLLFIGLTISAISLGMVLSVAVVVFPLEGFLTLFADKFHLNFAKLRQIVDVVLVVICVALSFFLKLDFAIREGTIIAAMIYSPIMGYTMKKFKEKFPEGIK